VDKDVNNSFYNNVEGKTYFKKDPSCPEAIRLESALFVCVAVILAIADNLIFFPEYVQKSR
jgi:hypothetical protein